mmetsp:Transcript_11200/g.25091  ORF Transcript_11200/g.25091 Transcript_11200/m.25091 type:complete len:248 (+) Transcript_11200:281-1024(+)
MEQQDDLPGGVSSPRVGSFPGETFALGEAEVALPKSVCGFSSGGFTMSCAFSESLAEYSSLNCVKLTALCFLCSSSDEKRSRSSGGADPPSAIAASTSASTCVSCSATRFPSSEYQSVSAPMSSVVFSSMSFFSFSGRRDASWKHFAISSSVAVYSSPCFRSWIRCLNSSMLSFPVWFPSYLSTHPEIFVLFLRYVFQISRAERTCSCVNFAVFGSGSEWSVETITKLSSSSVGSAGFGCFGVWCTA